MQLEKEKKKNSEISAKSAKQFKELEKMTMGIDTIETTMKEKDQKLEDLEKEKNDRTKQLLDLQARVAELEGTNKAKHYLSKELKRIKKKLVKSEESARVVAKKKDKVIAECDDLQSNKLYMEEQIHNISDFGQLSLDILQNYMHAIFAWIENNPGIVSKKKEEWKKHRKEEARKKDVGREIEKKSNEDQLLFLQ